MGSNGNFWTRGGIFCFGGGARTEYRGDCFPFLTNSIASRPRHPLDIDPQAQAQIFPKKTQFFLHSLRKSQEFLAEYTAYGDLNSRIEGDSPQSDSESPTPHWAFPSFPTPKQLHPCPIPSCPIRACKRPRRGMRPARPGPALQGALRQTARDQPRRKLRIGGGGRAVAQRNRGARIPRQPCIQL